jgi:hypothetical protein
MPWSCLQAHLAPDRLAHTVTWWLLSGAESLFITALGFPVSIV